jgi:glutamine amidotransferase
MNGINAVNGVTIVQKRLKKERPVLGICIGMQIMFSQGTENSQGEPFKGMGIWNGVVNRLNAPILPHMGWNTVDADPDSVLLKGIEEEPFYFVHSYAAKSAVGERQGWSFHGERFLAVVEDGYVCSTQFHPEKSGTAGLKLIRNWVDSL